MKKIDKAIELIKQGLSNKDIFAQLDICKATLSNARKRVGIKNPNKGHSDTAISRIFDENIEQIKEQVAVLPLRVVAENYNISVSALVYWLKKYNFSTKRERGYLPLPKTREMVEFYRTHTMAETIKKYNVTRQWVSHCHNRMYGKERFLTNKQKLLTTRQLVEDIVVKNIETVPDEVLQKAICSISVCLAGADCNVCPFNLENASYEG